ncbi:MAG TPA: hypothetical protein VHV83_15500, partial [Armatimonadota bacterium]|nr:hypothetical protein [Armatimonadota bacterium]
MKRFWSFCCLFCCLQVIVAAPIIVPDNPVMQLDELGIYEVGYAYRGQPQQQFPVGWTGNFESNTGMACMSAGRQNGKDAFLLHCPWRNGTGVAFQQFTFALPNVAKITLTGATAMRSDVTQKSDGVIFRIIANGTRKLETLQTDSNWRPFTIDLSAYAGKVLTLRFETDPGPNNNANFDFSLWADRALTLHGMRGTAASHPAPPPLPLSPMTSTTQGGVVPRSGFAGTVSGSVQNDMAVFSYHGPDGRLVYRWQLPTKNDPLFGQLTLSATQPGEIPVAVPLARQASVDWAVPCTPISSHWEPAAGGVCCVRTFRVGDKTATLRITGRLVEKSLVFDLTCDQPIIRSIALGGWGPVLRRRQISIPFYSGTVQYLPTENIFVNAFFDWTHSSATSLPNENQASYGALTDGQRNLLHESIIFTAAWHVDETLPNIPNPPSPYRQELGKRTVLDIWGGNFTRNRDNLLLFHDYGIRDCAVIMHSWQRSGYDNALPMHYPANSKLGGDTAMAALVKAGTDAGYRMA